jgi:hypothetical protein
MKKTTTDQALPTLELAELAAVTGGHKSTARVTKPRRGSGAGRSVRH